MVKVETFSMKFLIISKVPWNNFKSLLGTYFWTEKKIIKIFWTLKRSQKIMKIKTQSCKHKKKCNIIGGNSQTPFKLIEKRNKKKIAVCKHILCLSRCYLLPNFPLIIEHCTIAMMSMISDYPKFLIGGDFSIPFPNKASL